MPEDPSRQTDTGSAVEAEAPCSRDVTDLLVSVCRILSPGIGAAAGSGGRRVNNHTPTICWRHNADNELAP